MNKQNLTQKILPNSYNKIVSLNDLEKISHQLKKKGKTIVQCHGVFDLLHPGHILHFEAAKREGDILIVTLTKDEYVGKGPGRPVFNQRLRAESIASLGCVDYVAINEWPTAIETIQKIKPNLYVKGSDYENPEEDLTGKITDEERAVQSAGGRIHFTHEISFSSTEILNRHYMVYPDQAQLFLESFRKKYSVANVIQTLKDLHNIKALVIGDTIIDEYHFCHPMGKSPKESIVATKYLSEEAFPGGILACANHLAGFSQSVNMVSCLGKKNSREDFILEHMKPHVEPKFFYREDAPTIVKRRYVWDPFLVKMFEVVFLEDRPLSPSLEKEVLQTLNKTLHTYDLVLVADYGHGFLTPNLIHLLCKKSKFLAVNTQTNSANTGYNTITKYPRADYICIDEPEMRLAHQDRYGKLEDLILKTSKNLNCQNVTVTRGHLGSLIYSKRDGFFTTPIFSKEIVDRVGAGDAFLAVTAPLVAKKAPTDLVGFIGNAVGALAVRIVGNKTPVEPVPLFKFITALLK
ncbi:MAG: adenylyltransferase/cytidyltransferase family protein [Elusimicrobia bacterium]|nr:adenylyltransferase/cytidyltransferase family protein [Elusimicrobiota bacterium]